MTNTDNTPSSRTPILPDIRDLPAMLTIPTAAQLLGISRATAYRLAAARDLPVPVVPVGNSLRVPAAPLLALLGLAPARDPATAVDDGAAAPHAGGAATAPGGSGAGADQDAQRDRLPGPGPASGDGETPTR